MKPSRLVAMKTDAFTGYGPEKMVVVVSGSWPFGSGGCDRRDSNPHGLPHRILSPARLPVPPRSRCCGTQLSESLRAPSGSVRIVPADREHAPTIHALQLLWLSRQCLAMATAGADRVARAPTHWHVDRVPGAGHHGPVLRPEGDDLEGGSLDADGLPVNLEHHFFGRESEHFVPRPSTDVAIHLAAHASPLRCFGHPRPATQ